MSRKLGSNGTPGRSHVVSVRFNDALLEDVRKMAAEDRQSVSDWIRNAVWLERARREAEAAPPIPLTRVGWQCPHLTLTSGPGILGNVTAWCGCEMQPIYADRAAA